jgi:hypothetical protein
MTAIAAETIPDPLSDPWRVVSMALLCEARGEAVSEALTDAVEDAAVLLTCRALMAAGMSSEKAVSQFDERDYEICLSFNGATDEFGLTVVWADGEGTTVTGRVG